MTLPVLVAAQLTQNNVRPFPGSNAVTHIATMSEQMFSFFVFLRSSLPLLCLCPFFYSFVLAMPNASIKTPFTSPPFTSHLFSYAARRNPFLKPVTLCSGTKTNPD